MNRLPVNLFRLSNVQQIPSKYQLQSVIFTKKSFQLIICYLDVCSRAIHLSGINMNIIWRRNRRLPKNPTQEGPLTDLPDYTFMDGRPTPLGVCYNEIHLIALSINAIIWLSPGTAESPFGPSTSARHENRLSNKRSRFCQSTVSKKSSRYRKRTTKHHR